MPGKKKVAFPKADCWACRRKLGLQDRYAGWVNAPEYFAGMKKHFGFREGANRFIDIQMLQLDTSKVRIDVIKFDDWLREIYGNYEDEKNWSMREVIENNYSKEAALFIQRLL